MKWFVLGLQVWVAFCHIYRSINSETPVSRTADLIDAALFIVVSYWLYFSSGLFE